MPRPDGSGFYDMFGNDEREGHGPPSDHSNNNNNSGTGDANSQFNSFAVNSAAFDAMLEALPDDINFTSLLGSNANSNANSSTNSVSHGYDTGMDIVADKEVESRADADVQTNMNIFDPMTPMAKNSSIIPIDIDANPNNNNNLQNGEIAQFWDFTMDTFQMTPSNSSDSATISAPNSYSSDVNMFQFPQNNNTNGNSLFSSMNSPINTTYANFMNSSNSNNNNNNNIQNNPNSPSVSFNNTNSFNNNTNVNNSNNPATSIFKQSRRSRKSSLSQLGNNINNNNNINTNNPSKTNAIDINQNGTHSISIPLSAINTSNSIRKTSQLFSRQVSSSSLANLNKRPSSISELSSGSNSVGQNMNKKPQIQCFNCKTFKTPLWRRDPKGNTLCNACGLFQKLHGTMRPLSLKSDVIKKRNTKKRTKKNQENSNNNNSSNTSNVPNTSGIATKNNIPKNLVPKSISQPTATTATTMATTNSRKKSSPVTMTTTTTRLVNTNNNSNNNHSIPQVDPLSSANLTALNTNNSNNSNTTYRGARRSSATSNTSSKSSTSRAVVPILPKPVSSSNNIPFNSHSSSMGTLSASNSAASSPRFISPPGYNNHMNESPFQQQGLYSSSVGRSSNYNNNTNSNNNSNTSGGINISRRKLSRNPSASSSFIANSLQNLQKQNQNQNQNQIQTQRSATPSATSTSWNNSKSQFLFNNSGSGGSTGNISKASPARIQSSFDLFSDGSKGKKEQQETSMHTSLLSQQLQQGQVNTGTDARNGTMIKTNDTVISTSPAVGMAGNSPSLRRTSFNMANYTNAVQFQRHGSFQQQSNLMQQQQQPSTNILQNDQTQSPSQSANAPPTDDNKVSDELDWLRFGM